MFQVLVLVVSITFLNRSSVNWIRKTKVIIQLDKSLSKLYSMEWKVYIMQIRLIFAINLTAIAKVNMLGNAVGTLNANICHEGMQMNNCE
jgi:hypothetical protein